MLLKVTICPQRVNNVFLTSHKRPFPQGSSGIHHVMQYENTSTTIKWEARWLPLSWFLWRYNMATNGIDVQDMKVIVNRSAALLACWYHSVLQRLDGHIEITAKYPIACGGYADIYPGIWRGVLPFLSPGVWTGEAISGRNVVGTVRIYIVSLLIHERYRASRSPSKSFEMRTTRRILPKLSESMRRRVSPFLGRP